MKKIIIIIFSVIALLLGVIILFTPKEKLLYCPESFEIQDNRSIEFKEFVKQLNSEIIIVKDNNNKKICDIRFYDVINNCDEMMVTPDFKYVWLDVGSQIKYNNRFLWCKAYNGHYIIVDYINGYIFKTLSYYQLKIGAVFGILIMIIIILLAKIRKLNRLLIKNT